MSNTATIGTFGNAFLAALIPATPAGLCNGAKSIHFSISLITSSFISTDLLNISPPCTILCPTAVISSNEFIMLYSGFNKTSNTKLIASS